MSNANEVSAFETACLAFEIRFESELDARWSKLEAAAIDSLGAAEPLEKRRLLNQFFIDAGGEIAAAVQGYFPKMLKVAIAQRDSLGDKQPLEWTEKLLLSQTCTFLGIDPGSGAIARERLVMETTRYLIAAATARPVTDEEWTEEEVAPPEFALPWWMDDGLVRDLALIGRPFPADSDLREDLPVADSLDWIASKGYGLLATLNQQIEDEAWDGLIAAGQSIMPAAKISNRGRPARLDPKFVASAGELWRAAADESSTPRVSDDQLRAIARRLDELGYIPPLEGLERKGRLALDQYNKKHLGSPINTWAQLVERGNARPLQATRHMRRLLLRLSSR